MWGEEENEGPDESSTRFVVVIGVENAEHSRDVPEGKHCIENHYLSPLAFS